MILIGIAVICFLVISMNLNYIAIRNKFNHLPQASLGTPPKKGGEFFGLNIEGKSFCVGNISPFGHEGCPLWCLVWLVFIAELS